MNKLDQFESAMVEGVIALDRGLCVLFRKIFWFTKGWGTIMGEWYFALDRGLWAILLSLLEFARKNGIVVVTAVAILGFFIYQFVVKVPPEPELTVEESYVVNIPTGYESWWSWIDKQKEINQCRGYLHWLADIKERHKRRSRAKPQIPLNSPKYTRAKSLDDSCFECSFIGVEYYEHLPRHDFSARRLFLDEYQYCLQRQEEAERQARREAPYRDPGLGTLVGNGGTFAGAWQSGVDTFTLGDPDAVELKFAQ